jgi:tRNA (guanine-N7-)-methyltransferase
MPRVKLSRFRVHQPEQDALAAYMLAYPGYELHFQPETLTPITADALFGRACPLVIDFGCGRGDFVIGLAQDQPDSCFVGIDFHQKSLWDAVNKASAADVTNLRFLHGDIRRMLKLAPDASVSEAYMLFPPPYLKPSKLYKDPLPEDTLREIARLLEPGAPFHFVTDSAEYFDAKRALIADSGWFEVVATSQGFEGGKTYFQQFWEKRNIESRRLEAHRTHALVVPHPEQDQRADP